MKHLNKFEEVSSEKKINESTEIMLGDNKIYDVKEGDQLRFMEHYKNHLIKKYSSSFTDEINLDEPVTFVRVESSNLIRPNLIVRTKEGVEWVFGPEAFVLDIMKHLKKFEEVSSSAYYKKVRKLRKDVKDGVLPKRHIPRIDNIEAYAKKREDEEDISTIEKRRSQLAKFGTINVRVTDITGMASDRKSAVGTFYPFLNLDYSLFDRDVPSLDFMLNLIPVDDESLEILKSMPEAYLGGGGPGTHYVSLELKLEEGTFELGGIKIEPYDESLHGNCQFVDPKLDYQTIKNILYTMFSDPNSGYPSYDDELSFYEEFEQTMLAGEGLQSDHGLTMQYIAKHIKNFKSNNIQD